MIRRVAGDEWTAGTATVVAMSTPGTLRPDSDQSLVARIVAGDDRALGHVYDRYGSLVYGLARRVTNSTPAAEEITQEVFVQFWEHADRFDTSTFLVRAAFVISCVLPGPQILIYLALWILIPNRD